MLVLAHRVSFMLVSCMVVSVFVGASTAGVAIGQTRESGGSGRVAVRRNRRDVSVYRQQAAERFNRLARELEQLARDCDEREDAAGATAVRESARPFTPGNASGLRLPRAVTPPLAADLPEGERAWQVPLRAARKNYAEELYSLAQKTLAAGHPAYAFDLVREVAERDPDHPPARRVLGYVRLGDEWVSPFEARMARERKIWDDRFGWIASDQLGRYEQGERPFKARWLSAEREAEIRRDFANAWEVRTEHYLVRTNQSFERGLDLARKLEVFQEFFRQLLPAFFETPEQLRQMMAGAGGAKPVPKPLVVHYYRTRDEYVAAVRKETQQRIEQTRGIFFPRTGVAHFFHDPEQSDDSTLYHEAAHQLLSGARPAHGEIGVENDFWPIEGIACYVESFVPTEGGGGALGVNQRVLAARQHLLQERYYIPYTAFCQLGMHEYQADPEIKRNYAQGAGLVHFFLNHDEGRYRDAFIEYLSQVYSPTKSVRTRPEPIYRLADVEPGDLDREYERAMRELPATSPSVPAADPRGADVDEATTPPLQQSTEPGGESPGATAGEPNGDEGSGRDSNASTQPLRPARKPPVPIQPGRDNRRPDAERP